MKLDISTLYEVADLFDKRADYYQKLAFKGAPVNAASHLQFCMMLEAKELVLALAERQEESE